MVALKVRSGPPLRAEKIRPVELELHHDFRFITDGAESVACALVDCFGRSKEG